MAGYKFMPEIHLRQLIAFNYSAYGPFTRNRKKNKETGDSRYTYQNELNEACIQHNMA